MPVTPLEDEHDDDTRTLPIEDDDKSGDALKADGEGDGDDDIIVVDEEEDDDGKAKAASDQTDDDNKDATQTSGLTEDDINALTDDEVAKRLGNRVQRRIAKLVREREEEKADAARARARVLELEETLSNTAVSHYETEFERLEGEMEAAMEENDMTRYHKLNMQLVKLGTKPEASPKREPAPASDDQADTQTPALSPATTAWMENNADWFLGSSENFDAQRHQRAMRIEDQLIKIEGYSAADPELYEELDRRLARAQKNGKGSNGQGDDVTDKASNKDADPGAATPAPGPERDDSRPRQQRRITRADLQSMERYGFDPANTEHRRHWLERNQQLD